MYRAFPGSEYYEVIRLPSSHPRNLAFSAWKRVRIPFRADWASRVHTTSFAYMLRVQTPEGRCILAIPNDNAAAFLYNSLESAPSCYDDIGAKFPSLALRPACVLCTLHVICSPPLEVPPDAQHSVPDCLLGFVGATFSGRLMSCASRRTSNCQI